LPRKRPARALRTDRSGPAHDRCLEELKLESPTVRDDPSSLLISIGAMAGREAGEIPLIGLPGITATLKTGDLVEMDGAAGTVRILEGGPG
jgi:hypothetical protein